MKRFVIGILFLLLSSCEVIVDVNVPVQTSLILNSFFNPDSLWSVNLSLNRSILDRHPITKVENAFVVVFQDDLPIDTLIHQKNGTYRSDTGRPSIGKNYEIKAIAEGYQTLLAKSSVPVPTPITNFDLDTRATMNGEIENTFRIKFKDDPTAKNYYQIILIGKRQYIHQQIRTSTFAMTINSDDPILKSENANFDDGILLNDASFNGKEIEISFKDDYNLRTVASTTICLRTINKDVYEYKTQALLQNKTSSDAFAQPVNVFSNVENGFGIFGGYSQYAIIKTNPKPVITSISPTKSKPGDHITITLENLDDKSYFYNVEFTATDFYGNPSYRFAKVVRMSSTELDVIVPDNAVTGKVYVNSFGWMAESDFEVIN